MSESKGAEVKYARGLTPFTIALIVVLGVAMFYVNYLMWWRRGVTLEPFFGGRIGAPIYLPWGFIWLLAILMAGLKKFSVAEIVVLVGALYVVMDCGFFSFWLEPLVVAYHAQTEPSLAQLLEYIPSAWAPKDPRLVAGIFSGGTSVPGEVVGPLLLQSVFMFIFLLMGIFTAQTMIRPFVEVERLTFPAVMPAVQVLRMGQESSLTSFGRSKLFYIGFIIGLIIALQSTLNYIWPAFPVFFAWGQIYLSGWDAFLKGINPSIMEWWMFIPADTIMFFLAPIDVTASVAIWTGFKSLIWPFIAVGAGLISPGASPDAGPIKPGTFSSLHVTFALGIWSIIFGWKTWSDSFKRLYKRAATEPGRLDERLIWTGLLGSYFTYLLFFAALGAHAGFVLLFLILLYFALIGHARIWGETGQWPAVGGVDLPRQLTLTTAYASGVPNPWPSTTWWATKAATRITHHIPQATWFPWAVLSTYKLARDTGTSERDLFIGQLIAAFLASFIGLYLGLALLYAYGADTVLTRTWYVKARPAEITRVREVGGVISAEGVLDATGIGHFIAALVIVGGLWFMRVKFPWFFFTPVALFFYSGMWFLSSFPALILKLLVLKVAGMTFYEKYAVPLAIGLLVGISFGAFLLGSIAAFYIPPA
ncbi:MAG: DUF6785 family protein [Thermofilaceae archaeon]